MTPEWTYLLKANIGIILFYACYKLFCQRDTFFVWHRTALLGFLVFSLTYPLLDINDWMKEHPIVHELTEYTSFMPIVSQPSISTETQVSAIPNMQTWLMYIYVTGIVLLTIRFLTQIASIFWMRQKGETVYFSNQKIINIPHPIAPFSFFKWIFIHVPQLKQENYQDILTHEQTHANQHHSIDALLSEFVCIICWFNPFVWLLKNEIRLNLEYLADKKATEGMNDYKQYQYHLLEVALANPTTNLYNYFNVLHLKKRIVMMNKKRTRMTGSIKYALFAPLAIALLLASNISCTSSTEQKNADSPAQTIDVADNHIFEVVEENAAFPGGQAALMKWLQDNLEYPAIASDNGIQGNVYVTFVVNKDGSIEDVKIDRGVDPHLDKEALRAISKMPKWKPARQDGKNVRIRATVPVKFKLAQ